MQNTNQTQNNGDFLVGTLPGFSIDTLNDHLFGTTANSSTSLLPRRLFDAFSLLLAATLVALALCAFIPAHAFADDYSMPEVVIDAQATTEGDLHVVEQRTFSFDGTFSAVWWVLEGIPDDGELVVNNMKLTYLDDDGNPSGEEQELPKEAFQLSWREEGGPKIPAYSVDIPQNTVYAFFPASYQKVQVTFDYTITKLVRAWEDVGEVYWKYVGDKWAESSSNITMTLTLPVPENEEIGLGSNVYAWGHGPLDGTVDSTTPNTITYNVPALNSGQYAEAHVCFPTEWLSDFVAESQAAQKESQTTRFQEIIEDEQIWADEANQQRVMAIFIIIAFGVIALCLLIWAIVMYQKHGKEHNLDFTDQYWRDVPSPQDHPAVIARLWRWNKESNDDFTATLMYLTHKGAIQINKGSYEKPGLLGSKTVDDYYLTKVPAVADALTNPIDKKAISFLFDTIGEGANSLWFGSIELYGKDHAQQFVDAMAEWQGIVSGETNKRDFFELKSKTVQSYMVTAAVAYLIACIIAFVMMENFIPVIVAIPITIAMFVIANYMPRRSREGNNLDAKSKALRNWLKDFSSLDERPPTDVKVWGEFMVYAYIFGIAKQVISDLKLKIPELFAEGDAFYSGGYVPWYFWYSSWHGSGGVMGPATDLFGQSLANTVSTAQAAISGASGDFSSGGGFGGGFSGGGGGGFGGGGGGAR